MCLAWQEMEPHFVQTFIPQLEEMSSSLQSVKERERTVPPIGILSSGGILLEVQTGVGGWDAAFLTSSQLLLLLLGYQEHSMSFVPKGAFKRVIARWRFSEGKPPRFRH